MAKYPTREAWLNAATKLIDERVFAPLGHRVPKELRTTCGFPSKRALSLKNARIGECWDKSASNDAHVEVIISMKIDDPIKVLDIHTHELVHGIVGCACGHKGPFAKLARKAGLTGKLTATVAGPELMTKLTEIAKKLGDYPHARINAYAMDQKKQSTRLRKCQCDECGYVVRTTAKWIDEVGAPLCPCNSEPMTVK